MSPVATRAWRLRPPRAALDSLVAERPCSADPRNQSRIHWQTSPSCSRTTSAGRPSVPALTPILLPPRRPAGTRLPVDRLRRQPRARERDRGPAAGRAVRPPQRRERRRAHRPQLPVGAPVRRRGASGRARHRLRSLRLWRRPAAWKRTQLGLIDNWLRHVQDVVDARGRAHASTTDAREDRLCELNVLEQATNVCRTTIVQDAWRRGQPLTVHGWIYRLETGSCAICGSTWTPTGNCCGKTPAR